jgi:hypothetical protein
MKSFLLNKTIPNSLIVPVTFGIKSNLRFLSQSLINNPFFAPIPFEYIRGKEKIVSVIFEP